MKLLDDLIGDVRSLAGEMRARGLLNTLGTPETSPWPRSGDREILLQSDTRLELGSPRDESAAFLLWTQDRSLVQDGRIALAGPDLGEANRPRLPFGRVILVAGHGFTDKNCTPRIQEMDLARYDISLKGYMMRAVSQYMREWSRISHSAVETGFSFAHIGRALVSRMKAIEYVDAAEVLFITADNAAVRSLKTIGDRFLQFLAAMNRMNEDPDMNCNTCDFQPVCNEAEYLRRMHRTLKEKQAV